VDVALSLREEINSYDSISFTFHSYRSFVVSFRRISIFSLVSSPTEDSILSGQRSNQLATLLPRTCRNKKFTGARVAISSAREHVRAFFFAFFHPCVRSWHGVALTSQFPRWFVVVRRGSSNFAETVAVHPAGILRTIRAIGKRDAMRDDGGSGVQLERKSILQSPRRGEGKSR